jgi:two-component system, cell cycle response regulator DivK
MARVLVVEDQDENLDLMVYLLTAFGHETLVARDGAEGLAVASLAHPDLVVMDLQMPVMDGYEAAARLRAVPELARIPLVAVTAYAMVGDQERILQHGFDGYLTKPIDPESFVSELERHLTTRTPARTQPPGQQE